VQELDDLFDPPRGPHHDEVVARIETEFWSRGWGGVLASQDRDD
jgi:hypothetical protein